jgi:hypothetical protein
MRHMQIQDKRLQESMAEAARHEAAMAAELKVVTDHAARCVLRALERSGCPARCPKVRVLTFLAALASGSKSN